jgi:arginine deiminase
MVLRPTNATREHTLFAKELQVRLVHQGITSSILTAPKNPTQVVEKLKRSEVVVATIQNTSTKWPQQLREVGNTKFIFLYFTPTHLQDRTIHSFLLPTHIQLHRNEKESDAQLIQRTVKEILERFPLRKYDFWRVPLPFSLHSREPSASLQTIVTSPEMSFVLRSFSVATHPLKKVYQFFTQLEGSSRHTIVHFDGCEENQVKTASEIGINVRIMSEFFNSPNWKKCLILLVFGWQDSVEMAEEFCKRHPKKRVIVLALKQGQNPGKWKVDHVHGFIEMFYTGIGQGSTMEMALQEGRKCVQLDDGCRWEPELVFFNQRMGGVVCSNGRSCAFFFFFALSNLELQELVNVSLFLLRYNQAIKR